MRELLLDRRVFVTNGVGGTRVPNAVAYFYLVGKDIGALEQESEAFQRGKSQLYRQAVDSERVAFAVIDIASEKLKKNLETECGIKIYELIEQSVPCIVKTKSRLKDVTDLDEVVVSRLANPDQDFQWAIAEMALLDFGDRITLLNILKFINENFKLEPGLFGVKWQGNTLLKRWIDTLEATGVQASAREILNSAQSVTSILYSYVFVSFY